MNELTYDEKRTIYAYNRLFNSRFLKYNFLRNNIIVKLGRRIKNKEKIYPMKDIIEVSKEIRNQYEKIVKNNKDEIDIEKLKNEKKKITDLINHSYVIDFTGYFAMIIAIIIGMWSSVYSQINITDFIPNIEQSLGKIQNESQFNALKSKVESGIQTFSNIQNQMFRLIAFILVALFIYQMYYIFRISRTNNKKAFDQLCLNILLEIEQDLNEKKLKREEAKKIEKLEELLNKNEKERNDCNKVLIQELIKSNMNLEIDVNSERRIKKYKIKVKKSLF